MIRAAALLLGLHFAGEILVQITGLPLPGPVVGLLLLLSLLIWRGGPGEDLSRTADGLLSVLALLFVPAGVGVIAHLALIGTAWPGIVLALTAGPALVLAVTGWTVQRLLRSQPARDAAP